MTALSGFPALRRLALPHSLFVTSAALLLILSAPAHATDLVVDGGFESATGTTAGSETFYNAGSSLDGGAWNVTAGTIGIDTQDLYVDSGDNSAILNGSGFYGTDSLSQTLSTVAGQSYEISFWANAEVPNSVSVTFGGIQVADLPTGIVENGFPSSATNGNSSEFEEYTAFITAASNNSVLTFTTSAYPDLDNPDATNVELDNVSVVATPEPSSIFLMFTGLVALGLFVARKRTSRFASVGNSLASL